MKVRTALLTAALALVPVVGFAQTYTQTFFSSNMELNDAVATSLVLPKFNTAMGTLTGVHLSLGVDIGKYSVTFYNNSGSSVADVRAQFQNAVSPITATGGVSLDNGSGVSVISVLPYAFDKVQTGSVAIGGNWPWSFDPVLATSGADIGSSFIDTYKGTGNFSLVVISDYAGDAKLISGSEVTIAASIPSGKAMATVTYTFIPEPSTYAMILGAITLGLVGWRRFRR